MTAEHIDAHEGISGFEVSSPLNPERIFEVVDVLNTNTPPEDRVRLEIYPTKDRFLYTSLQKLSGLVGFDLPTAPTMDRDFINSLVEKHPNVEIGRTHLGFTYDEQETKDKPKIEPGIGRKARSYLWGKLYGPANDMRSVDLATEFGTDINAHANVIEGFARDNKLDDLRQPHALLLVENETERSKSPDGSNTLDPRYVVEQLILPHNLDGLVLGYDHDPEGFPANITDPLVRDHLRVIHFAAENHAMMSVDDPRMEKFVQALARVQFAHPVTVTFDLNPQEFGKLSINEQVDYINRAMDTMKSVQTAEQASR